MVACDRDPRLPQQRVRQGYAELPGQVAVASPCGVEFLLRPFLGVGSAPPDGRGDDGEGLDCVRHLFGRQPVVAPAPAVLDRDETGWRLAQVAQMLLGGDSPMLPGLDES